jgi:hypothetical protein
MSNQANPRRAANAKNKRHDERPGFAMGCSDEGHNGKIGRAKWVALSRRNERRNAKQGRPASIQKFKKKTFKSGTVRKVYRPKPAVPDTGEDQ